MQFPNVLFLVSHQCWHWLQQFVLELQPSSEEGNKGFLGQKRKSLISFPGLCHPHLTPNETSGGIGPVVYLSLPFHFPFPLPFPIYPFFPYIINDIFPYGRAPAAPPLPIFSNPETKALPLVLSPSLLYLFSTCHIHSQCRLSRIQGSQEQSSRLHPAPPACPGAAGRG